MGHAIADGPRTSLSQDIRKLAYAFLDRGSGAKASLTWLATLDRCADLSDARAIGLEVRGDGGSEVLGRAAQRKDKRNSHPSVHASNAREGTRSAFLLGRAR
jgi:hypothetical protein